MHRTYENSLDCPALGRVRKMEDVLAGYRANGEFSPERWFLMREAGRDVGCLLLTEQPLENQCEIVYVGVVAEARRQGIARAAIDLALDQTRAAGRPKLIVAMDAENVPARELYAEAGFVFYDTRKVLLCLRE